MNLTISQEQYEALLAFAQRGTRCPDGNIDQNRALALDAALKDIESSNGITRYSLWVRWQDPTAPLPPGTNFPKTWPPNLQYFIQFLSRPITQSDVMAIVAQKTSNAVNVMVTPDPAALLGWTKVNDFFVQP
jgi:hypothetical protein